MKRYIGMVLTTPINASPWRFMEVVIARPSGMRSSPMNPIHIKSVTARSVEKRAAEKAIQSISQQILRHWRLMGKNTLKPIGPCCRPMQGRVTITVDSAGTAAATSGPGTIRGRNYYILWPVLLIRLYPKPPATHISCWNISLTGSRPSPQQTIFVLVNIQTSRSLNGTNVWQILDPIYNQSILGIEKPIHDF